MKGMLLSRCPNCKFRLPGLKILKMDEDETISDFYTRLWDICNEAFYLGKCFSKKKLVRKALRSLLERFAIKVTTIKEAKDITTLRLDELIGSFRTFELNLKEGKHDKLRIEKNVAFNIQLSIQTRKQTGKVIDKIKEQIALLSKNFSKPQGDFGAINSNRKFQPKEDNVQNKKRFNASNAKGMTRFS
ncbi:hypothetical protein PVK06_022341 [Gossypium arboreum]|uniref:Gag-pol polyprotein n=1 Tax=Gossypium arboreum TaxID=29729 RepID=A0ABR0P851_GOSAR|nr:hypothetical protein PVK06_022341 [Gossypium arboreum]